MTGPSLTREQQALLLADTASRRRLSPDEAGLLRRRITELAARAGEPSGGTGPGTRLSARVSAEQAQRAPIPAPAPERHAAAHTAPTIEENTR